jgi:hypothetical protein
MTKVFHIFISLLVAVPFGTGGLCCCLFGEPVESVPVEPAHSCCGQESVPIAPSASGTEDREENCTCPDREAALVANISTLGMLPAAATVEIEFGTEALVIEGVPDEPVMPRKLHPPPKLPLHQAYCVLLC